MPVFGFVAVATAPYLVFRDNSFARLIDHQSQTQSQDQISYDDQFADLYAQNRGRWVEIAPWRLALVTVMQNMEGLSDRQAADAVRRCMDWK